MIRLLSGSKHYLPCRTLLRSKTTVPLTRKKKKNDDDNNNNELLNYNFHDEAKLMLKDIENAITPMKAQNNDFEFVKLAGEFQVNTGENGWFIFRINNTDKTLSMSSPISGPFEYKYCPESKNWLSVYDKHDLRGMIVRDMLRKFIGIPKF